MPGLGFPPLLVPAPGPNFTGADDPKPPEAPLQALSLKFKAVNGVEGMYISHHAQGEPLWGGIVLHHASRATNISIYVFALPPLAPTRGAGSSRGDLQCQSRPEPPDRGQDSPKDLCLSGGSSRASLLTWAGG